MEPARGILAKVVAQSLRGLPDADVPMAAWPFAAGGNVAERTDAVWFRDGVLTVSVPDANWRNQMRDMAAGFLSRLNQYSRVRVDRIEFIVASAQPAQDKQ